MLIKVIKNENKVHLTLLMLLVLVVIFSMINPYNWLMWHANFWVGFVYLFGFVLTYRKMKFTTFTYIMIFIHLVVIFVAAKYTYEKTPLFLYLQDVFNMSRNQFDRVGHFLQGAVPVLVLREILIKNKLMQKGKMFVLVVILSTMGISGLWEVGEFIGSELTNNVDLYILSCQGDLWDAEWDMLMCLIGALFSLIVLSKYQDSQISKLE